jgi:predicted LPLAT superfamily acyltransferase
MRNLLYPALNREHGFCGSMAAALQILRHAHNERVRQSIQHVLARLERCPATGPVAHNSTYGAQTR